MNISKIKKYDLKLFDATKTTQKFDCIVTDLPYGKGSKLSDDLNVLYRNFLKTAFNITNTAVVLFPDFVDPKELIGKWKIKKRIQLLSS